MKKIEIDYIHGFASFLDEKGIKFTSNSQSGKDRITFEYKNEVELFQLAYEFGFYNAEITLGE